MIEAIQKLKQLEGANFSEVCEKHVFEGYRLRSDGCMQEVTVVVLDAGPEAAGQARFYCHARSEEGRVASSRLESTLDAALASMRWTDLDPEPAVPGSDSGSTSALAQELEPDPPVRAEYDRRDLFDRFRRRLARKTETEIESNR
jgi:hypothetical protein